MSEVNSLQSQIIIIGLICIAAAVIVIVLMCINIIRPLARMVGIIERFGNADFSKKIPDDLIFRKDEIGTLGKSMARMQTVIREIFRSIISETDLVEGNVVSTQGEISELSGKIDTVDDLTSDRAAEMQETAASTELINQNALNVKDSVGEISDRADRGISMADDINERATKLKEGALDAQRSVVALTAELRDRLDHAVEESKAVNQINALSDAILDIASETELLSLNASIEAARAGEAGKGFAVVAEQIGKLAENSQETVGQIQEITKQVVIAVNNLADNSMETIKFIDENILKDYDSMVGTGEQYYQDANAFRDLMETIGESANELMESIAAMTESVSEISLANSEGAHGITTISHNTSDIQEMSSHVSNIMDEVQDSALKLKEKVNKLTI